jgi:Helix-turn-helix domain
MLTKTALYQEKNMSIVNLKKINLKTKQGKLFKALVMDREVLTPSAITKRFGIKNPRATISNIRYSGYAIYANRRRARNGVDVTEYHYGEASREMVIAAYRAMSVGLVN